MAVMFVSCPFCNANMPLSGPVPSSHRIICVRCGEQIPLPAVSGLREPALTAALPAAPVTPAVQQRKNRRIGLLVLGGMAVLFCAALFFALQTRGQRGTRSLAESPALGYLPDDTNLIAAVNVEAADDARKERKAGAEPDIADRLFFANNAALPMAQFTGLQRTDVEEIMLGLRVDTNLIPKVRLIVRTRTSYDAEQLRERLGSFRSKQEGTKKVDSIRPKGLPLEAVLWCATERTFVVTLTPEDMDKVPNEPAKNVERLSPQLVDLLRYRGEKGTFFWLVGHADNWEPTGLGLLIKTTKKVTADERAKLFKIQTFAVAMRVDSGAVTSRARPARITEQVDVLGRGWAVDLVLNSATDADGLELRGLVESWLKAQRLEIRDSTLKGTLYTASLAGTPDDWDKVLSSVRGVIQLR